MRFIYKQRRIYFVNYTYFAITSHFGLIMVLGILPMFVLFVNSSSSPTSKGKHIHTLLFLIIIDERFKADLSLLTYELTKIKRCVLSVGLTVILDKYYTKFRYTSELDAYANQCFHLVMYNMSETLNENDVIEWAANRLYYLHGFAEHLQLNRDIIRYHLKTKVVILLKVHRDLLMK